MFECVRVIMTPDIDPSYRDFIVLARQDNESGTAFFYRACRTMLELWSDSGIVAVQLDSEDGYLNQIRVSE